MILRGRLVLDRTTAQPKLNCRNWECGVVIPIPEDPAAVDENSSADGVQDLDRVFGDTVPVPMKLPAPEYGPGNKPWYYLEDS